MIVLLAHHSEATEELTVKWLMIQHCSHWIESLH